MKMYVNGSQLDMVSSNPPDPHSRTHTLTAIEFFNSISNTINFLSKQIRRLISSQVGKRDRRKKYCACDRMIEHLLNSCSLEYLSVLIHLFFSLVWEIKTTKRDGEKYFWSDGYNTFPTLFVARCFTDLDFLLRCSWRKLFIQ